MKKLEELLDLPQNKEILDRNINRMIADPSSEITTVKDVVDFDKIAAALPYVKGLGDICDQELDELAQRATTAYDDLMDLGMNIEPRFSGRIFEVASAMLKNAIEAKTAKMDKKLRMIELQLKKQRLDERNKSEDPEEVNVNGYVITDRNSLLERIKSLK